MTVWRRLLAWWADDLPPMSGGLRVIFYAGLLYLALDQFSPLTAAAIFEQTPPALRTPVLLFRMAGLESPPHWLIAGCYVVCLLAWLCSIVGFLTTPAMLVTAASAVFLHGLSKGLNDFHGWILPVYSLVFLCLSRCDEGWTLDAVIRRRWPAWPGPARGVASVRGSGLARKLVTLAAVHTFFAGGIAKLTEGGLQWADGRSLQAYILTTSQIHGMPPRFAPLAALIASHLWLCALLSLGTLLLELGSPLALFSRRCRGILVVAALVFHVGVYLVLFPDFFAQAWCYILVVDWARLASRGRVRVPARGPTLITGRSTLAAVSATALAGVLLVTAARGVDEWPLTSTPMYRSYFDDTRVSDVALSEFDSVDGMARMVDLDDRGRLPWASRHVIWRHADVVLKGDGDERSIKASLGTGTQQNRFRWTYLMRRLVLQEFRRTLKGEYDADDATLDAAGLLTVAADGASALGVPVHDYSRIELVYRVAQGSVTLFSAPVAGLR